MTVSELNAGIRTTLESRFSDLWVEGEISGFLAHSSGHWYFTLTDGVNSIKAACYKSQNYRIRFRPSDGLHVRCRARISIYEKRSEYQLVVDSLEPVGEGALTIAFEQIKARLAAEGLFDQAAKRPIPLFPRRVGIVTSPDGAAVHDIMTVLDRRARSVSVVLVPTAVQGEFAAVQIAAAIRTANDFCGQCLEHERIDVLIVGRGGGSADDLWAFNEERVARAIRASGIPVISAVGHEIDFTIADLAADLRAATPSAAAEIVAASEAELKQAVDRLSGDLEQKMRIRLLTERSRVRDLSLSPVFAEFPGRVRELRYEVDQLAARVEQQAKEHLTRGVSGLSELSARLSPQRFAARLSDDGSRIRLLSQRARAASLSILSRDRNRLETLMGKLDTLSPLSVLKRGYSIAQKRSGEILRNSHQTSVGDFIEVRLGEGSIDAEVRSVRD